MIDSWIEAQLIIDSKLPAKLIPSLPDASRMQAAQLVMNQSSTRWLKLTSQLVFESKLEA